jgi:hypothetical protein
MRRGVQRAPGEGVATTASWLRLIGRAGAAAALALGLGGATHPAEPDAVGTFYSLYADGEMGVFVDRTSTVRTGDLELYGQTAVFAHPQGTGRRYSIVVSSWKIDCEEPRQLSVGVSRYDEGGRLLGRETADPNHWSSIYPGSPLDSLRSRLCGDEAWPDKADFVGTTSQLRLNFLRSLEPDVGH